VSIGKVLYSLWIRENSTYVCFHRLLCYPLVSHTDVLSLSIPQINGILVSIFPSFHTFGTKHTTLFFKVLFEVKVIIRLFRNHVLHTIRKQLDLWIAGSKNVDYFIKRCHLSSNSLLKILRTSVRNTRSIAKLIAILGKESFGTF